MVDVLMCVSTVAYGDDAERYLRESTESILKQTYKDFRLLAVLDGPEPEAKKILNGYGDKRINVIEKRIKTGLTDSLNTGLLFVYEPFILRQDIDDISTEDRLETLLSVITLDDSIGVVGDNYGIINSNGDIVQVNSADPQLLRDEELAGSVAGGGTIIRTSALKQIGGWQYYYAQDLFVYIRMRQSGYNVISVPDTLYYYRVHDGQISTKTKDEQKSCHKKIVEDLCTLEHLYHVDTC